MRILWGAGTARTLRAHWMLHELRLPYESRLIGSRTGETQTPAFRALNPGGKIPVLQDGDLTLCESAAIVNYLGERYGGETGLVPTAGTDARAHYDRWCFYVVMELDAHTLYVIRRHRDLADLYGEAPEAVQEAEAGFRRQVGVAAEALGRSGPHLLGEKFTGADVLLTSCLDWALFYRIELDDSLQAYRKQTTGRDAYQRAAALNFSIGLPPRPEQP